MSDLTDADRAYTAHHIDALRMDVASAQHRATTAEKQRDLALDGHRLDDEMIDQLRHASSCSRMKNAFSAKRQASMMSGTS